MKLEPGGCPDKLTGLLGVIVTPRSNLKGFGMIDRIAGRNAPLLDAINQLSGDFVAVVDEFGDANAKLLDLSGRKRQDIILGHQNDILAESFGELRKAADFVALSNISMDFDKLRIRAWLGNVELDSILDYDFPKKADIIFPLFLCRF
jgi:hypothetical protein